MFCKHTEYSSLWINVRYLRSVQAENALGIAIQKCMSHKLFLKHSVSISIVDMLIYVSPILEEINPSTVWYSMKYQTDEKLAIKLDCQR